jgi:hypothetical protein
MPPVIPVPQEIHGCPVVAAIAVPSRPGELPCQYIVTCQQDRPPPGEGPYVTWRAGTRDGREWAAEQAQYDPIWPQAVATFARRASLPAPGDPPGPASREAGR